MKTLSFIFFIILMTAGSFAQNNIGINNPAPHPSAALDVTATDKGILIPRMTTIQRLLIPSPATGLIVFDTSTGSFWFYNGSKWAGVRDETNSNDLYDADGNTKIEVEASLNEDTIRFSVAGIEYFKMSKGRFEILNSGKAVFVGEGAGYNNSPGTSGNVFIGYYTGNSNTNGISNTATGYETFLSNTEGNLNTATGVWALRSNINGSQNTANGFSALYSNTTGNYNIAIGRSALESNTTGSANVALGQAALYSNTSRSFLIALGDSALFNNGTGTYYTNDATNNIAIGHTCPKVLPNISFSLANI